MSTGNERRWAVIADSQIGNAHERIGRPNQDSFQFVVGETGVPPIVVAVSDGHSSESSFRSQVGSALAAKAAVEVGLAFAAEVAEIQDMSLAATAILRLPDQIVSSWRQKVDEHVAANPFQDDELDRLQSQKGLAARVYAASEGKAYVAYGATLVSTIICNRGAFFLRLGDGEIITVMDGTGGVTNQVFTPDDSQLGDVCDSLCGEDPGRDFRVLFQPFDTGIPALILLCTDGYDKSFSNTEGFLKVGTDLIHLLRTDGASAVKDRLPTHLKEVTLHGAGDDVTVAIIWRVEAVSKVDSALAF